MIENTTGFFKPKSKEKTPSLDERIASDPGRAKQDMQAAKERESAKSKFIKQVADAKSESSVRSNPQYKSASVPDKIASSIPTEAPKAAPKAAPIAAPIAAPKTAPKTAPVVKPAMESAPTSKYRGGRSEEDINRMIAEATPDRMRASQFEKDNPDATPYKKGGMVKSGASRGDGCAQRGRTRGTMR